MLELKKKQLLRLALFSAGILLILKEYQLYEKQQKAKLNIGKGCIVVMHLEKLCWKCSN